MGNVDEKLFTYFNIFTRKNLVLILADDCLSHKQLLLLTDENVIDKFEITYNPNWINSKIYGFPSVYDRNTKCTHLGYATYSEIIQSLKDAQKKQL